MVCGFVSSVVHCLLVWVLCLQLGRASDVRSQLGGALPPPCVQKSNLQPPPTLQFRMICFSFSVLCQEKETQH